MKIVGLRELKNRLGMYMNYVRAGESVAITDRGEVIAELTPYRPAHDSQAILEEMARRGEVTLPKPMTPEERKALYADFPRPFKAGTAKALLDADRDER